MIHQVGSSCACSAMPAMPGVDVFMPVPYDGVQADEDNSGEVDFEEFCSMIERHKASQPQSNEQDMVDAFLALGGGVSDRKE